MPHSLIKLTLDQFQDGLKELWIVNTKNELRPSHATNSIWRIILNECLHSYTGIQFVDRGSILLLLPCIDKNSSHVTKWCQNESTNRQSLQGKRDVFVKFGPRQIHVTSAGASGCPVYEDQQRSLHHPPLPCDRIPHLKL